MSALQSQLEQWKSLIEASTPYAYKPYDPFNRGYRHLGLSALEKMRSEESFRLFCFKLKNISRAPRAGVSITPTIALVDVIVIYPLANQLDAANAIFAEETTALERLLCTNADFAVPSVVGVSHLDSAMLHPGGVRLAFVHRFQIQTDE